MASDSEVRAWLKGIGEKVAERGKIGQRAHDRYDAAHAGNDGEAFEDFGEAGAIIDVGDPLLAVADHPSPTQEDLTAGDGSSFPPAAEPPPGPDEPPAHARRDRSKRGREKTARGGTGQAARPPRVTAAIRGDITAKVSFALEIPGRVWEARDPVCGGTFIQNRAEIADALTEIVCGSPDLVAWFTGQGGQFMLVLNLAAACWPVVTMVMAHHVYHTVELGPPVDEQGGQPDYSRYAA